MMDILYCIPRTLLTIGQGLLALFLVNIVWRAYWIYWGRRNKLPVRSQQAVLITGSSAGIGLAVAKHLYSLGYSVMATYCFQDEEGYAELESLANNCKKFHPNGPQRFLVHKLDVRSEESIQECFNLTIEWCQKNKLELYGVINNAGIGALQPFSWMKRVHIRDMINTNLTGSIMMAREFLPLLIKSKGRLINVSSGLGYIPGANYIPYGCTKAAMIYFTRAINKELNVINRRSKDSRKVKAIVVSPANFIKHTDICSGSLKDVITAWDQLSEFERQVFDSQYEEHFVRIKALDQIIKNHHAAIKEHNKELKRAASRQTCDNPYGPMEIINKILHLIKRMAVVTTLEDSGILDTFEDALRLENPCEHILGGEDFYNIIGGAFMLSFPTSLSNWWGDVILPRLYK